VLLIHGGGWTQGDKQGFGTPYCTLLAQQGFVVGNINYRLARDKQPATQWPAPLVDAQLAVRWLRAHANNLNLDPQRLCAWGTSAGGHLAVFLGALKTIHPGDEALLLADQSPAVSCVIDYFGPTDLTQRFPLLTSQITTLLDGTTLQSDPQLYHDASPIFSITADTAPMIIVQGIQDTTVPPIQSQTLYRILQQYKVPVQYISYNGDHSFYGLTGKQRTSIDAQMFNYLIKQEHS
jgi:acetyl esterase/lipase